MWNIKGTAHKQEKPHEKLQKNKEIADIIKKFKYHIWHSQTKCSSSIRSYGLGSQNYAKNYKPQLILE
jgi:hypothetical protein